MLTFAPTTKKSYRTQYRAYIKFCGMIHKPVIPASTDTLCLYATYLASFLLPQSVCLYVNFVGVLHKQYGLHNPLADNYILKSVLRGIRRVYGVPARPRYPMTTNILLAIHSRLNFSCSKHASFWAICLTMFFGLFRRAHFVAPFP